jgi:hypothetical protein
MVANGGDLGGDLERERMWSDDHELCGAWRLGRFLC